MSYVPFKVFRTTLAAAAATITVAGLDGDADGEYDVSGRLDLLLAAGQISLEVNGSTTNVHMRRNSNNTIVDSTTGLTWNTNVGDANQKEVTFFGRFFMKRGVIQRSWVFESELFSNNVVDDTSDLVGTYTSEAANVTTLGFVSAVALGILAGSWMEVRKVL